MDITIYHVIFALFIFMIELFWFVQLLDLMSRPDSNFVGKYDKPCWVAILLAANWIGALAYICLKPFKASSEQENQTLENAKPRNLTKMPNAPKKCPNCGTSMFYNANACLSCGWTYEGSGETV